MQAPTAKMLERSPALWQLAPLAALWDASSTTLAASPDWGEVAEVVEALQVALFLSHTHTHSLSLTHTLSLFLSYTHTHSLSLTLSLSLVRTLPLTLSLSSNLSLSLSLA